MSVVAPVTAVLAVVVSAVVGTVIACRWARSQVWRSLSRPSRLSVKREGQKRPPRQDKDGAPQTVFAAALLAGVLIGVFFAALKQTSSASGLLPLVSARLASLVALGGVAVSRRPPLGIRRDVVWLIVVGGALDIFANVLYLLATRQGMLTIAATLTSLYPASTILLARFFLGERLRRIQIVGLACAGLGVVLIGAG